MIAIIETFISGNISDSKRRGRNRSFMKLVESARDIGFEPVEAWNIAATIKGFQSFAEYCQNTHLEK